ncbi:MAG: RsmB/NOP family class I SAM-dependent RNA methyltransferase [Asgard group archaeon]|nr:RsmB/NOP family class I SAM-dependent RNA methyltransferase [Asgard group archaeon]
MVSDNAKELAGKYGYLEATIERFIQLFGKAETIKMLEAYEKPPKQTIRVNTLKINSLELERKLSKKGFILTPIDWFDDGFTIENEPLPIGATTEYLAGYYFIQSKASWLPSLILNPSKNDLVIDMAAAPGGKATHLAQLMENKGSLLCFDISRERMKSLRSNLSRCGIINSICFRMDSREINNLNLKVDKILLDAPCSGEGLMALDYNRRKSRDITDIERMMQLQNDLLEVGLRALKKNGILVYSTCSTAPEENERVIDNALEKYSIEVLDTNYQQFEPGLIAAFGNEYHHSLRKANRLYPQINGTEGFFVCKVKLKEDIL